MAARFIQKYRRVIVQQRFSEKLLNTRYSHSVAEIIDEKIINEFHEHGAVCIRGAFHKKWLDLTEDGLEKNLREPSKHCDWLVEADGKGLFFNDHYNYRRIPEYLEYVTSSPAAEIAGRLMKSKKSIFFHDHVFYKEAASPRETPWHHDQAYYPIDGNQNCSIWMPTTKVRKESCLKFLAGSHKFKGYFIPRLFASNKNYPRASSKKETDASSKNEMDIDDVVKNISEFQILQWELELGDCIAFHMKTIHGTQSSFNPEKRIVMATRWLGDDTQYAVRRWPTSPPKELLPESLTVGDNIAECKNFLVPWQLDY